MRRLLPLLLALCLLLCACAAEAPEETPLPSAPPVSLPPAPEHPYAPLRVYLDGLLSDRGCVREGTAYLAPETLCVYYGLEMALQLDADGFSLTLPGLTVRGDAREDFLRADGRYLYTPDGWLVEDGRLYLPCDAVERIFGLEIALSEDGGRADAGSTGYRLLRGGEDYYERSTQADDLYWLTHIIYSEAHYESLAGQIGVGNVVCNRVASDAFPATIMAVVLDREHTLQFTPVGTGEVTAEPDETAVIAACLVLEGYNTAGDSLYFVNPQRGDASWFERSLTPVCVIGSHHFYK